MIYFLQADRVGLIKIGHTSRHVNERIATIRSQSPVRLSLLATMEGDWRTEQELHDAFVNSHSHGEWFWPTRDIVDYIKNLRRPILQAKAVKVVATTAKSRTKPSTIYCQEKTKSWLIEFGKKLGLSPSGVVDAAMRHAAIADGYEQPPVMEDEVARDSETIDYGRPRHLRICLTKEWEDWLDRYVAARDRSKSQIVRLAVAAYGRARGEDPPLPKCDTQDGMFSL